MGDAAGGIEHQGAGGEAFVLHYLDPGAAADRLLAVLERLDPPDVQPHRRVELQRPTAAGRLRRPEHHSDLLPELVDEDRGGAGVVERPGELAEGLTHQPGLQADVAVPHLTLDLGAGHQSGDRVDDDDVKGAGADEHVGDLQRLLPGIGLGHQQRVGVDAERLGVLRVERVLGVDVGGDAAARLRVGHRVQSNRRLAAGLRAEDLYDPAAGQAADAERDVQRDRPGGYHPYRRPRLISKAHDRALAKLLVDLGERDLERLVAVESCHRSTFCGCRVGRGSR